MRFGVLGPLVVWADGGRQITVPERKTRRLLADLLASAGRPVSVGRLVDDLWGADLPANPANALQGRVAQLRRALEAAEPGGRELVVYRPPGYLLQVGADAIDAHRFQTLTAQARTVEDAKARAALLVDALALWRGPAFADVAGEEFARAAAARLEEQRLVALEDLAEARLALGEHRLVVGDLADLVARHPLRERLRATQMRALYRAGRQSEALGSYQELRTRLREEQGLDPSPELAALQQAILRQDPSLAATPAPAVAPAPAAATVTTAAAARPRSTLPAPLTDLVGREQAVAEVRARLDAGRLVTLTGPGGVGKTRLALEAARQLAPTLPDGAHLVELVALDPAATPDPTPDATPDATPAGHPGPQWADGRCTPATVAGVIAEVLGIRDVGTATGSPTGGPADLAERLGAALRTRRMLLVLDNCERVIEPVAELAQRLLRTAPELKILATSQEPLRISGEVLQVVPPLEPPDPDVVASPSVLDRFSAVRLFVARAAAAAPGFALDEGNAATVAAICRRLDGLPLALELAAARVRALGVRELAARLDDRFRLLATGRRDAPARQQTLRAAIDWSWELLTEPERTVLRRVAVHTSSFTLEAAEAACADGDLPASEVLDLLARLVDRSLVVAEQAEAGTRYRLLESVAAFGAERLDETGEAARVRRRLGAYYAVLAERARPHLRGRDQQGWLQRLDAETANLRAALEHAARAGDAGLALRLVNALAWYWILRGRLTEAGRSLALALAAGGDATASARAEAVAWQVAVALGAGEADDAADAVASALRRYDELDDKAGRAHAEWLLSYALTVGAGDVSVGEDLARRALATFRALGDRWGVAAALSVRATQAMLRGDLAALARDGEESMALFRELGDRWGQLQAMEKLAELTKRTGDLERSARWYRDALRTAEELGLWAEASFMLSGLASTALLRGDDAEAEELYRRAWRLAAEQSIRFGEEAAEVGLGLVARRRGRFGEAEEHLRNWLEWDRQVEAHANVALILTELGFVAELRGDPEAALRLQLEGLAAARASGDPQAAARAVEGLAGAEALAGRHERAARLLGAAGSVRDAAGVPLRPGERGDVDRVAAAVRAAMGEDRFAAAVERGRTLDPDLQELLRRP